MSVSREVIANVVGIDAEDVRCENCESMPTFMVCKTWDTLMGVGEFCSFFRLREQWRYCDCATCKHSDKGWEDAICDGCTTADSHWERKDNEL